MEKFLGDFKENPHNLKTLEDVMEYTQKTLVEDNERWGMKEWIEVQKEAANFTKESPEFKQSLARRQKMGREIEELLDKYECDLLVVTSYSETPAGNGGCPAITVPLGFYPADWPVEKKPATGLVWAGPNIPYD
jgi:amidase